MSDNEKKKSRSPFKEKESFKSEIKGFLKRFNSIIYSHADRISDYFEMSCFNYIVQYYEDMGFDIKVQNLQKNKYRYKCTTSGNHINFSYFSAKLGTKSNNDIQIHHNLAVESKYEKGIYTTPDITVIKRSTIETRKDFYQGNKTFSYVKNKNLITFAEVKHFTPFPELLFNFIGTVNELKGLEHDIPMNTEPIMHFAPFLMISGKSNAHTDGIRLSLSARYNINIVFDLFGKGLDKNLRIRYQSVEKLNYIEQEEERELKIIEDEDSPF
ncbi:hypothetical protein [Prolixibacter sp. NT017]|uniref:hypothetical protein n=1 Tax=Prolixibacter sp. NT017 TaxID=2652390 RepID=UPI0012772795|nr:hypothetical protein [Prolixibacter sp. NT017]GET25065.1 hypothetical protein NT017_13940 [Prolixibacter sp. NT017]